MRRFKLLNAMWRRDPERWPVIYILSLLFILTIAAFTFNQFTSNFQNFVYEANGFLHGKVFYETPPPSLYDSSVSDGRYYWAPGPLPAIILMPLTAIFGLVPLQIYLNMALVVIVIGLSYAAARQHRFSQLNSLWLATAFTFASVYLGVAMRAHAWQVSSAVAAASILWMLYEYRQKNRPWVIGLAGAAALATRLTAGLAVMVPIIDVLLNKEKSWSEKISWLRRAAVPLAVTLVLLGALNYARTGNWLDTGYTTAMVDAPLAARRAQGGLFSLSNIPGNIFLYFFVPPQPVIEPGSYQLVPPYLKANLTMGFFFLSPIFLYLWRLKFKERLIKITALVAAGMTLLLLSYYALNAWEFGSRYLVDVLPLYYVLLLTCFPNSQLQTRDKALIAFSALFNLYLFTTIPWWSA